MEPFYASGGKVSWRRAMRKRPRRAERETRLRLRANQYSDVRCRRLVQLSQPHGREETGESRHVGQAAPSELPALVAESSAKERRNTERLLQQLVALRGGL